MTKKEADELVALLDDEVVITARETSLCVGGWEVAFNKKEDGKEVHARTVAYAMMVAKSGNILRAF